ncbi:MAG: SH3 domain-containing protein [Anaerolineae bacterium]
MILLPNVTREMLDPAFWLARVADPDAPLLDPDGIRAFNARVLETLNLPDPLDLAESISAPVVCGEMAPLSENTYYDVTGAAYTPETWAAIQANIAAGAVPDEARVRWGLVTQRTPLRYYPSLAPGLTAPGQIAFDRLQGTMLDTGWPAAVVHTSADGQWYFALTPMYWGWVQAAHVALADDREAVRRFIEAEPFVVAVASRATAAMPDGAHALAQMGTRLPLVGRDDLARRVLVPRRDGAGRLALVEGYIARDDPAWHEGYLPCTVRTAFTQAFSLLGEPYAWGGLRAGLFGRDCSRLVKDVWAVTGLCLPRNSRQQGRVGVTAVRFAPDDPPAARATMLIEGAPPGALLLLPGHIMLYLGAVDGVPFALHSLWNYDHPEGSVTIVASTVVSDLPTAPSANRRTLLERLTHVQAIGL